MTYADFINKFRNITIAEIDDNASYLYKTVQDKQNEGGFFGLEIL